MSPLIIAVIASRLPEIWHDVLLFSVGALTLAAAVREAYAFRTADKELVKQYRFMHRIFSNARRRLASLVFVALYHLQHADDHGPLETTRRNLSD